MSSAEQNQPDEVDGPMVLSEAKVMVSLHGWWSQLKLLLAFGLTGNC